MIRESIQPVDHRSPYRRIHPSHPGRKQRITFAEWHASETNRVPDPYIYEWSQQYNCWILKEGA